MKPSTKRKRETEKAVAWLQSIGATPEMIEAAKTTFVQTKDEKSLEAEGVLRLIEKPQKFAVKTCVVCEDKFGTNYLYVSHCSDACRARALRKNGIQWMPNESPERRWGGEPPLVIPPEALAALQRLATGILDQIGSEPVLSESPDSEPQESPPSQLQASPEESHTAIPDPRTTPDFSLDWLNP